MKLFNIKMSDTQKLQLDDMADELGVSSSTLPRAILFDGLKRVKSQAVKDLKESSDHIKLMDAKAKL